MNSALIHEQMSANGASGDDSLRGTTGNRWQAPVRVSVMCRGQDFMRPRSTGEGFGPRTFSNSREPRCLESSSPPGGAGRGLSALSLALPTFEFCVPQPRRQAIADVTPSTHVCRAPFANQVAAKEKGSVHNSRGERPEREGERHHVS